MTDLVGALRYALAVRIGKQMKAEELLRGCKKFIRRSSAERYVLAQLVTGLKEQNDAQGAEIEALRKRVASLEADFAAIAPKAKKVQPVAERPTVDDEEIILQRLYDGDQIVYSQDGDMAWFSKGDRAFVGDTVMGLREKGCLLRMRDPEDRTDNYRGMAEYDTISAKGVTRLREITALPWDGLSARSPLGDLYEVIGLSENVWATRINGTTVDGWSADERRAKAVAQGNYDFKRKEARK